jgi:hypothetical protein
MPHANEAASRLPLLTRDGAIPKRLAKAKLNELTLEQPTAKQISVTDRLVVRRSANARSARRRDNQPRGVSLNASWKQW